MADQDSYGTPENEPEGHNINSSSSLQKGIDGNYSFTISDVISEAWNRSNGFKQTVWGALLIVFIANFILGFFQGVFGNGAGTGIIIQVLSLFITTPLSAGVAMLGIYFIAGREMESKHILSYYDRVLKIVGLQVLMIFLIGVGMVLLILPGIYLAIAYSMAMPLMLEKNLGIWEALETSRKAITHKWFSFFGLYLTLIAIFVISVIPLGLGLIWAIPLSVTLVGVIYRTVFGVDPE